MKRLTKILLVVSCVNKFYLKMEVPQVANAQKNLLDAKMIVFSNAKKYKDYLEQAKVTKLNEKPQLNFDEAMKSFYH